MTSFSIQSPRSIHFMTTEGRVAGDKNKNNSRMISPILHQLFQTWLSDIIIWFKKGFPGGSEGKASAYNAGDLGSIPGSGRSPGEGTGTPLQYPCWKIPWTEKHGRLQSMGLQRVRHNWATSLHFPVFIFVLWPYWKGLNFSIWNIKSLWLKILRYECWKMAKNTKCILKVL